MEEIVKELEAKKQEWISKRNQSKTTPLRNMYQGRVEGIHYAIGRLKSTERERFDD